MELDEEGSSFENLDSFVQQCNRVACAWFRLVILVTFGIGSSRELLSIVDLLLYAGCAWTS